MTTPSTTSDAADGSAETSAAEQRTRMLGALRASLDPAEEPALIFDPREPAEEGNGDDAQH
jgi:hypothetical protein